MKRPLYLSAQVFDDNGDSLLVKVPVTVTTIPEVPQAIFMGHAETSGWVALLTSTSPVTYRRVQLAKAKKLRIK